MIGLLIWGWRHGVIVLLMLVSSVSIGRQLVSLQLVQHDALQKAAQKQYIEVYTLQPQRGSIYDSGGQPLVSSLASTKVAFFPNDVTEDEEAHKQAMDQIAAILGYKDPYSLWARVNLAKRNHWTYTRLIPYEVPSDVAGRLAALHVPWLDLVSHDIPNYPNDTLAAQALGFVQPDPANPALGYGQYGLEQYYDRLLRGQPKTVKPGNLAAQPSGASLRLTISADTQLEVETVLKKAVAKTQSDSGMIIVMDPQTGAILAMASTPTYNPNDYNKVPSYSRYVNPAISVPFEPGSTFKIVTVAAGLDSGKISPRTTVYDSGSAYCAGGFLITNWTGGTGWGVETPTIMLRYSANVGALKFARLIGASTFYRYVGAFGFGQLTGVDLADEASGLVRFPDNPLGWSQCDLDTNSFGQGLTVTPLQLITAAAAVANGGWLMRPYVVSQIQQGSQTMQIQPKRVRQVISAATAHMLTNILVESAKDGEAKLALVDGYAVAAKTGTAQVAGGPSCSYNCNLGTIASLIGYAPAHHPRFIALIVLKHPRTSPWGSTTAAPAFHELATRLLMMLNIPPHTPDAQ